MACLRLWIEVPHETTRTPLHGAVRFPLTAHQHFADFWMRLAFIIILWYSCLSPHSHYNIFTLLRSIERHHTSSRLWVQYLVQLPPGSLATITLLLLFKASPKRTCLTHDRLSTSSNRDQGKWLCNALDLSATWALAPWLCDANMTWLAFKPKRWKLIHLFLWFKPTGPIPICQVSYFCFQIL